MGLVRIVGGSLGGRRLRVSKEGVRPTSERIREAMFDILGAERLLGARVLDLYAGTGALGIEALSRGAESVDFFEGNPMVARLLGENLRAFGLIDRGRVHVTDLDRMELPASAAGQWSLAFLDPPYEGDAGARWIHALSRGWRLAPGGILIYERRKDTVITHPAALTLATERTYGDTTVAIYRVGDQPKQSEGGGV